MFDLDEDLTIESYRIPWLIWIQLLIFFFLIFLLYCFGASTSSDLSHNDFSSSSSSSSSSSTLLFSASTASYLNKAILKHNNTKTVTNRLLHNQVGEGQSIEGEIATSTSGRINIREENAERGSFSTSTVIEFHPCNYFKIAKLVFLKCFGLDSSSSSPEPKRER